MKITIHPIAALPGHPDDTVEVDGDTITVNGVDYDLSAIPEGGEATAEGEHPFAGPIRREGGELHLGLIYHYSTSTAEPDQGDTPPWSRSLATTCRTRLRGGKSRRWKNDIHPQHQERRRNRSRSARPGLCRPGPTTAGSARPGG